MKKHGFNLNGKEMKSLLSRLDRDWDGNVSYEEFKEIFYLTLDPNNKRSYPVNDSRVLGKTSQSYGSTNNSDLINYKISGSQGFAGNNSKEINNDSQQQLAENQKEALQQEKETVYNSNNQKNNPPKVSPLKESYTSQKLYQSRPNNFASTMSTIKGYASPLRESAIQDLNIRAAMNTYSPSRDRPTNYSNVQSQTQPRVNNNTNNILKSPFISNNFSRRLNYDYTDKNTSVLIRSVDRLNRSNLNQSKEKPANISNLGATNLNNNNNNNSLNYSLTNLNNSREDFFNQNYRNKLKSTSPKKYLQEKNNTYVSPRKDDLRLTGTVDYIMNRSVQQGGLSPSYDLNSTGINNRTQNKSEIEVVLAKFLQELTQIETNLEAIKESLSLKTDVKLNKIFACFDQSGKNLVSVPDFKDTLTGSLEIFSSIEDIKLLFKRFDQDLDCKLNFSEFSEMLTPKKPEYARLLKERRNYGYDVDLSLESKLILIKLFRTLIEGENLIENNRQFLTTRPLFSSYDAFDSVKGKYQNYILKENLNSFLQKQSIFCSQFELEVLFDRFDKNRDGRITFNEFIQEILPKSYYSY